MRKTNLPEFQSKHESKRVAYIPAFGRSSLTPLYDSMMKWAARESAFKPLLTRQTQLQKGSKVLDLGCGTGTLAILLKRSQPEAEVKGIDIDPQILELAKAKIAQAGLDVTLQQGTVFETQYPDNYFDRVVSSMVFHHLTTENKHQALKEVFRILKPSGELHVADLGKPQNALMHLISLIMGRLEENADNVKGLLPQIFRSVGFDQVEETTRVMTMFGTVALYKGRKPLV